MDISLDFGSTNRLADHNRQNTIIPLIENHVIDQLRSAGSLNGVFGSNPRSSITVVDGNTHPDGVAFYLKGSTMGVTSSTIIDVGSHILAFAFIFHPALLTKEQNMEIIETTIVGG